MNSLKAFKRIIEKYGNTNTLEGTYDDFLIIKKDLEALEILKKYLYVNHFITYGNLDYAICLDLMENSETEKIKEWINERKI